MLREIDPVAADTLHENNLHRIARALEIYKTTGKTITQAKAESRLNPSPYEFIMLTLEYPDRSVLGERINRRVDIMMEEGLLSEVKALYEDGMLKPETTAAQAIGYKEIVQYLEGKCTLEEAVEEIKLSSRRYAKRQLTWFRHEKDAVTLFVDKEDGRMKTADTLLLEALEILERA
jgi:tRNA dimethylallyltransferase